MLRWAYRLKREGTYRHGTLVRGTQLAFKDRVREFKVSQALLVALKHVHAAPEVVVDCRSVNCVSSETLLSDLPSS